MSCLCAWRNGPRRPVRPRGRTRRHRSFPAACCRLTGRVARHRVPVEPGFPCHCRSFLWFAAVALRFAPLAGRRCSCVSPPVGLPSSGLACLPPPFVPCGLPSPRPSPESSPAKPRPAPGLAPSGDASPPPLSPPFLPPLPPMALRAQAAAGRGDSMPSMEGDSAAATADRGLHCGTITRSWREGG